MTLLDIFSVLFYIYNKSYIISTLLCSLVHVRERACVRVCVPGRGGGGN